jgi:DNA-binding MarR family transcriptional regulator
MPSSTPRSALPGTRAAVLWAVIRLERPTTRSISDATGISIAHVHRRLKELRREGLVDWLDGSRGGTLRATVVPQQVGHGAPSPAGHLDQPARYQVEEN